MNQKKYNSTTIKIETRITDLGLNGKIIRLSPLNSFVDVIESEIANGAKTIIGVGDNSSFHKLINAFVKTRNFNKNIPIGFIPVSKNNSIATSLGIENYSTACDQISARRLNKFNLGEINDLYFLTEISIEAQNTSIEINKNFSLEPFNTGLIKVLNKSISSDKLKENNLKLFIQQKDGRFPLTSKISESSFTFTDLKIINKKQEVLVDHCVNLKTPVNIKNSNIELKIIIGKTRQ